MGEVFTILDFETTGLDFRTDQIIEVGMVQTDFGMPTNVLKEKRFFVQLEPNRFLPSFIVEYTGITKKDLDTEGITLTEAKQKVKEFIGDTTVIAHNAAFDLGFVADVIQPNFYCTRTISCFLMPNDSHKLVDIAKKLKLPDFSAHRALDDARTTGMLFKYFKDQLGENGIKTFRNKLAFMPDRPYRYLPPNAIVAK